MGYVYYGGDVYEVLSENNGMLKLVAFDRNGFNQDYIFVYESDVEDLTDEEESDLFNI